VCTGVETGFFVIFSIHEGNVFVGFSLDGFHRKNDDYLMEFLRGFSDNLKNLNGILIILSIIFRKLHKNYGIQKY
jgi:hypothetical protein